MYIQANNRAYSSGYDWPGSLSVSMNGTTICSWGTSYGSDKNHDYSGEWEMSQFNITGNWNAVISGCCRVWLKLTFHD